MRPLAEGSVFVMVRLAVSDRAAAARSCLRLGVGVQLGNNSARSLAFFFALGAAFSALPNASNV